MINEGLPTGDHPSVVDALPSGDEHVTSGAIAPIDDTPLHAEASTSAIDAIVTTPCYAKYSCTSLSPIPSTSGYVQALTPEDMRPFTKAAPRKATYVGRKRGRSRVLTDTAEKAEIEANYAKRKCRKGKKKGGRKRKRKITYSASIDFGCESEEQYRFRRWRCVAVSGVLRAIWQQQIRGKVDPVHCVQQVVARGMHRWWYVLRVSQL